MNFDVYVFFCHLVFVYSFEFVFSCQPWEYIIHNDATLFTVLLACVIRYTRDQPPPGSLLERVWEGSREASL